MSKIAITGATGFVGNIVTRKLLTQGHRVRVLMHVTEEDFADLNVEIVHGDIRNIDDVKNLCKDCTHVLHIASYISIVSHETDKLHSVNVEGTRNVIATCMENKISLVYVSSVEAIGKQGEFVHSETESFNPDCALISYGESKAQASLEVLEASKKGLHAVIVCPSGIAGPHDYKDSRVGIMVKDFLSKKLPAYPSKGGFCFVDVRDVADAIIAAKDHGKSGNYYIVTSDYIEIVDLMNLLQEISDVRKPLLGIPLCLMRVSSYVVEFLSRIFKFDPLYTTGTVNILASRLHFESRTITKELGIKPRSLRETFSDQIAWCRGEEISL